MMDLQDFMLEFRNQLADYACSPSMDIATPSSVLDRVIRALDVALDKLVAETQKPADPPAALRESPVS
jgi:hypothetical protein